MIQKVVLGADAVKHVGHLLLFAGCLVFIRNYSHIFMERQRVQQADARAGSKVRKRIF